MVAGDLGSAVEEDADELLGGIEARDVPLGYWGPALAALKDAAER
jgi:hypothetical protein